MPIAAEINTGENGPAEALKKFLKQILESGQIEALLVPCRLAESGMILPALIADPEKLCNAEPLSPAFAINSARLVSRLTRHFPSPTIAALMRPCEIRAFAELVKLNQGHTENLIIIGTDCAGAMQNKDFFDFYEKNQEKSIQNFIDKAFSNADTPENCLQMSSACRVCTRFLPEHADLSIGLFGLLPEKKIQVYAGTSKGENLLNALEIKTASPDPRRQDAAGKILKQKTDTRAEMIEKTRAKTDSFGKLADYLSRCINCYNCRNACPVCYCRECVFTTDVFDHEPDQYLKWARQKGAVKMPVDTLFYHLTRMAHISTACVGCGQCSNACPSGIDLADLFISVADKTQAAFDYTPGKDPEQLPPLAEFNENEFEEVVGITD